jgi:hypothetical protein
MRKNEAASEIPMVMLEGQEGQEGQECQLKKIPDAGRGNGCEDLEK